MSKLWILRVLWILCWFIAAGSFLGFFEYGIVKVEDEDSFRVSKPGLALLFISLTIAFLSITIIPSQISKEKKKRKKQKEQEMCDECRRVERITPEIPYCQRCFQQAFVETEKLANEAEQRMELAKELELKGQAEGAKNWLAENLPAPIKWLFQQAVLSQLKKRFPQIKPFDPTGFEKHPLDTDDPAVNIPQEGLEVLAKMFKDGKRLLPKSY